MKWLSMLAIAAVLAASPAAYAQEKPDPVRLDLARQLVAATGGTKNAEQIVRQMYGSMDGLFAKAPAAQQRVFQAIQRDMQDEMLKMVPALLDMSTEAYARVLTEKELRDMLAFQTSESGQSIAAKTPTLVQELVKAQIPMIQAAMPRLLKKAADRACEESKCTPAERQQVATALEQMMAKKTPS